MTRLGVIGAGGMAATVLGALRANLPVPLAHLAVLVRPGRNAAALLEGVPGLAAATAVHTNVAAFLDDAPDVVAECAGHAAVREYGTAVLARGIDFVVVSSGALADDALLATLRHQAERGGARLVVVPGAVGGIDVLAAARLSGLQEVVYSGRKPPLAWRGTAAEQVLDLSTLREPAVFFEGTAREAAQQYPQNANVAATVALAGIGMDATRVRLVADPAVSRNVHEISVRSEAADYTIRLEGRPSPSNPRTSLTAGFSVARELLNRASTMVA